jgi:hypothetical protein
MMFVTLFISGRAGLEGRQKVASHRFLSRHGRLQNDILDASGHIFIKHFIYNNYLQ